MRTLPYDATTLNDAIASAFPNLPADAGIDVPRLVQMAAEQLFAGEIWVGVEDEARLRKATIDLRNGGFEYDAIAVIEEAEEKLLKHRVAQADALVASNTARLMVERAFDGLNADEYLLIKKRGFAQIDVRADGYVAGRISFDYEDDAPTLLSAEFHVMIDPETLAVVAGYASTPEGTEFGYISDAVNEEFAAGRRAVFETGYLQRLEAIITDSPIRPRMMTDVERAVAMTATAIHNYTFPEGSNPLLTSEMTCTLFEDGTIGTQADMVILSSSGAIEGVFLVEFNTSSGLYLENVAFLTDENEVIGSLLPEGRAGVWQWTDVEFDAEADAARAEQRAERLLKMIAMRDH